MQSSKKIIQMNISRRTSLDKQKMMPQNYQFNLQQTIKQLKQVGQLSVLKMRNLLQVCSQQFQRLPNIIQVKSPVTIVGDIHGQFYDLLHIFEKFGQVSQCQYLFMGDYVDRGCFCIQVISLLLCLKHIFPQKIHLLRGNHQSRLMTTTFNFREQCLKKYDQQIYSQFMDLFDKLPLAAIVDGKYFCVHAGISPSFKNIFQIQKVNRLREPPEKGGICDLLWSDPVDKVQQKFTPNKNRMCSYFYGINQSRNFLNLNKLKLIIRGHQVQNCGYKYQKNGMGQPYALTIFSAPNYCDTYRNKGSVLKINQQRLNIFTFSQVTHPIALPNYMNLFQWSIPFMAQSITKLFKHMLKLQNTKQKKAKAQHILNNTSIFRKQIQALLIIQSMQKVLTQHKQAEQLLIQKQTLSNPSQYSPKQFIKIKKTDFGQKYPKQNVQIMEKLNQKVIGPQLHKSFTNLNTMKSIDIDDQQVYQIKQQDQINQQNQINQQDQINELEQFEQHNDIAVQISRSVSKLPTLRML